MDQRPSPEDLAVLNQLRDLVAQNAEVHGFREAMRLGLTQTQWEGALGQLIRAAVFTANQHAEASEFWEAFRHGTLALPCDKAQEMADLGLPVLTCAAEEIADELIRILDKAHAHGVDVAQAVSVKHAYNVSRPYRHGGKLA